MRTLTHVIYALQAAALINGLTLLVAVIVNYAKREEVKGTIYESHFDWQIATFWRALLIAVALFAFGVIYMFVAMGGTMMGMMHGGGADVDMSFGILETLIMLIVPLGSVALLVYFIYRVVKGWLRLNENRPAG